MTRRKARQTYHFLQRSYTHFSATKLKALSTWTTILFPPTTTESTRWATAALCQQSRDQESEKATLHSITILFALSGSLKTIALNFLPLEGEVSYSAQRPRRRSVLCQGSSEICSVKDGQCQVIYVCHAGKTRHICPCMQCVCVCVCVCGLSQSIK